MNYQNDINTFLKTLTPNKEILVKEMTNDKDKFIKTVKNYCDEFNTLDDYIEFSNDYSKFKRKTNEKI